LNQVRTFSFARGEVRKPREAISQSRLGSATLPVTISTRLAADLGWMVERHDAPVGLRAAATMPDLGVHVVSEVEHGRARGQVDHLALRRQQIHPVLDQFGRQAGEQGAGHRSPALASSSCASTAILRSNAASLHGARPFLVAPVRGDAEFRMFVHVVGADLDLEGLAPPGRSPRCAASGSRCPWACAM
jgi:hypothetical protein